jgi:hypothetical protein
MTLGIKVMAIPRHLLLPKTCPPTLRADRRLGEPGALKAALPRTLNRANLRIGEVESRRHAVSEPLSFDTEHGAEN